MADLSLKGAVIIGLLNQSIYGEETKVFFAWKGNGVPSRRWLPGPSSKKEVQIPKSMEDIKL